MNPTAPAGFYRILFVCITFVLSSFVLAGKGTSEQQRQPDVQQLEKTLRKAKPSESKVNGLVKLAEEYIYIRRFDKADSISKVIGSTSANLPYEAGLADFHYLNGLISDKRYQFDAALKEQRIALEACYRLKDKNRLGNCYLALGSIYSNWEKPEKALTQLYKALAYFEKTKNEIGVGRAYVSIGKVLDASKSWADGVVKASTLYKKAEKIFRQKNDRRALAELSIVVSRYHTYYDCYVPAQQYVNYAKEIYAADKDTFRLAIAGTVQGWIDLNTNKLTSSRSGLVTARKVLEQEDDKREVAFNYLVSSYLYYHLAPADSIVFFTRRYVQLMSELECWHSVSFGYDMLAQGYTELKDYENAYECLRKERNMDYAVNIERSYEQVRSINAKYEADERQVRMIKLDFQQRMSAANLEQQTTYTYLMAGGIVLVALVAGFIYIQLRNRQRNRLIIAERDRVLEEQKAMNYRLQALSAQMNPHFIFNSLTSIQRFMLSNDIDNSNRYLSDFSRLMRQTLENSQETTVSLSDEVKMLETYLRLEQMRVSDKFEFQITVDPEIDTERTYIPTLLIQPYAENAIWHGIGDEKMSLQIHLYPNKEKELICCTIDDNGVGRPTTVIQRSRKSYGMSITKARLELINLLEDGQINVEITDKTDANGNSLGTKVQICFPSNL